MFICIDLKSFYASVECVQRGYDPLNTNLVVADISRTEKTICLAVTPSLKAVGVSGRARLFEVNQKVREHNLIRRKNAPYRRFSGKSFFADELAADSSLELDYIAAPPQMTKYMEVSTQIYDIYLRYVSAEDIHVYSIDEVFIDATAYLETYECTARELAIQMINDVLSETGITATAGIGTNLYLAKIAMDIVAKKMPPDKNGVRIAELDELSYRQKLWDHKPITDFWRVGSGIAKRLAANYMYTMGDVALCSYDNEDRLYKLFGKNAELLIDHAWGWEPCTMKAIKNYRTREHSISQGQVLSKPYKFSKGRLIVHEMADILSLELVRKKIVTDQIVLTICYDHTSDISDFDGELCLDHYGKRTPKPAHGSINLNRQTSSTRIIVDAAKKLYDRITNPELLVRKIYVVANHVVPENQVTAEEFHQFSLFEDNEAAEKRRKNEEASLEKEKKLQHTMLSLKEKYGKNAVMRAMNYQEDATAIQRNSQVGGHRA